MRVKLCAVFDVKAKAFNVPFPAQNVPIAVRMFTNSVNNPQHTFAPNPEDYTLHLVGEFDDETGAITPMNELLVSGLQVVKVKE